MLGPHEALRIEGLKSYFRSNAGLVKSVDGVDLSVGRGESLAIVGESGSGKSVTSLSVMRLLAQPHGYIAGGQIWFRDRQDQVHDLAQAPLATMRRIRGQEIAMIFQEPMSSLNPVFTVGDQIAESLMLHKGLKRGAALEEARRMLELVEIPAAARRVHDYPHQMSGGMRQRVMIALALACRPGLLIADEPTTALDVTIQAQILDLLRKLRAELGMSVLFITHNLGVVAEIADHVAVMYAGRVVEQGPVRALFERPSHPYTRALLACTPRLDQPRTGTARRLPSITGSIPSPLRLPAGCAFAPRCPLAQPACDAGIPPLTQVAPAHNARCLRWQESAAPRMREAQV